MRRQLQLWVTMMGALLVLMLVWAIPVAAAPPQPVNSDSQLSAGETFTYAVTTFNTQVITIPTYPYSNYLTSVKNPTYNITYTVLDWGSYNAANPTTTPQTYTLLTLENPYLRVSILPELGGRLYELTYKATGNNELYKNPVIKPTNWGPPEQGWWLSVGGIEWCLPVDEHGYEWGIPWAWDVITTTQGVTVTVRDTDANDRLRAEIALHLPANQAYLAVSPYLENPTATALDYKFWINAAVAPGPENKPTGGLEFIFNSPEVSIHSTGDDRLPGTHPDDPTGPDQRISWPVYNGIDLSKLKNWNQWLGFFEYPQAAKDFNGLYNHDADEGLARIYPSQVARGAKAFGVGWDAPIDWSIWTDGESSGGVEIHGGVAPTFWDQATLEANSNLSWTEFWYPIGAIGTLSEATRDAALGLEMQSGVLHYGIHPTRSWADGETQIYIWDRETCQVIGSRTLPAIGPDDPYASALVTGKQTLDQLAVAYAGMDGTPLVEVNPNGCEVPPPLPEPHLAYGLNVRKPENIPSLFDPLGFEWIKLWEEYDAMPTERLPYQVLYLLDCRKYVNDMVAWAAHIEEVAQHGQGLIEAYEICNEPNVRPFWNGQSPDPARFVEMLSIAHEKIKAVDPDAIVINGGLAPVGRVEGESQGWSGHDGDKMDERTYLQAMLDAGAGNYIDAFGYHPYGFAYAPEQDPEEVSNGFAFRGAEVMHQILSDNDLEEMPVWATEFNWVRDPNEDGINCDADSEFQTYFKWMLVTAQQQTNYLVRAYEYADRYWPWMQGMFIWNLDWHNYDLGGQCDASRFYALRKHDDTDAGATTLAYDAMAALEKRPGLNMLPTLLVDPTERWYMVEVDALGILTPTFSISNTGYATFTWTAQVDPNGHFTPSLGITTGLPGDTLWMTVDTTELRRGIMTGTNTMPLYVGVHTTSLTITAVAANNKTVVDSPQRVTLKIHIVPRIHKIYLPLLLREHKPAGSQDGPHGPSKIGIHAIQPGGTIPLVRQVAEGDGHVAVVKGVSNFSFLREVKEISPKTVTIGRWADRVWEALENTEGDPAAVAAQYMEIHMAHWESHRDYVDYWEILNEVDPPSIEGHAWIAEFFIETMKIAEENDYKLALFSYSVGVPEWYEWAAIVETGVFARAKEGGHILSLHEYSHFGEPELMSAGWGEPLPRYPGQSLDDPSIPLYPDRGNYTGRYRYLYEDFLIPRDEVIPLAITESNLSIIDPDKRAPHFTKEIIWYDDRLREDDYVIGMALFTLGGGTSWSDYEYEEQLPELAEHILKVKDE